VAKEKGRQLGGLRDKTMKRNKAIQRKANAEAAKLIKIIGPLREAGQTLAAIAETLNDMKVETSRGGMWSPMQVKRVLDRIESAGRGGLRPTSSLIHAATLPAASKARGFPLSFVRAVPAG